MNYSSKIKYFGQWIFSRSFILLKPREGVLAIFVYRDCMPCFGILNFTESFFFSKIWNINFPFLWVKIFSNCKFLGFSSVIAQNKFLAVKCMTKIG